MKLWAVEFRTARTWVIDYRTLRPLRRQALQAPLDLNQTPEYWDFYNSRLRAGSVRAVRVRIVRAAAALAGAGSQQAQVSSMDADRGGERSDGVREVQRG